MNCMSLFAALFRSFLEILKSKKWKKDEHYVVSHPAVMFLKQIDIAAQCMEQPKRLEGKPIAVETRLIQIVCMYYLLPANYAKVKMDLKKKTLLTKKQVKQELLPLPTLKGLIDQCENENADSTGKRTLDAKEICDFKNRLAVIQKREVSIGYLLTELHSEK